MSTRIVCDGCKKEIPTWDAAKPAPANLDGDGVTRRLQIQIGNAWLSADLCVECVDAAARSLPGVLAAEAMTFVENLAAERARQ